MEKFSKKLDFIFNKLLPKKFIIFVIATIFAFKGIIDGQSWTYVSMAYFTANAIQKFSPKTFKQEIKDLTNGVK